MADFRAIYTKFWRDPEINALTPEDRYFFLYLLTNPETTSCGIYQIPINHMVADTGYNIETIQKLLKHLEELGKVSWNGEHSEIFIHNWIKWNTPKNPSMLNRITKDLSYVKTPEFRDEFIRIASELGHNVDIVSTSCSHHVPKQETGNGKHETSHHSTEGGLSSPDSEKALKKPRYPYLSELPKLNARDYDYPDEFEEFWGQYPRQKEKSAAYKKWRVPVTDGVPPEQIANGAKGYAAECRNREKRHIKLPTTWLNNRCWTDYIDEDGNPLIAQSCPSPDSRSLEQKKADYIDLRRRYRTLDDTDSALGHRLYREGQELRAELEGNGVDIASLVGDAS